MKNKQKQTQNNQSALPTHETKQENILQRVAHQTFKICFCLNLPSLCNGLNTAHDNKDTQLFISELLDSRCLEFKHFIVLIYGIFAQSGFFTLEKRS